jgi:hypothetical protein
MQQQQIEPRLIDSSLTDPDHLAARLREKVEAAKTYLRARGKYVLDKQCLFTPTAYTDRIDIMQRYGAQEAKEPTDAR